MQSKRIAVLLSAYNGEQYIKKQIESILNQENINLINIIVRNDGSTDETLCVLKELQKNNYNLEILDEENIGLVASFLRLLEYSYAQGYDYYAFSDQDDYWLPEKLSVAIKHIENCKEPCMYAACSLIADNNLRTNGNKTQTKIRDISFYNSAIQNICPGHNQVLNHQMAGMIVQKKYSSEIYSQDLWITQIASVTGKIFFDNSPHTIYRQHNSNQLSFGRNKIGWVKSHIKRLQKNEGKKMALQLSYFCKCYKDFLTIEQKEEINSFFESQTSFVKRMTYILSTQLYRQRKYETFLFKCIYLMGGYNIGQENIHHKNGLIK